MNRRLATLASAAIVAATLGLVGPASPANAAGACAGTGTVTLSGGVGLPPGKTAVGFNITVVCAGTGVTVSADGQLASSCGNSTGTGWLRTPNGDFKINITTGATGVVIVGNGNNTAGGGDVVVSRGSCVDGTADQFTFVGAVTWP